MLALHTLPGAHAFAHPPQFWGSDVVLVQIGGSPQAAVFCGQTHLLLEQMVPPVQATPQAPQLLASVCVFTQAPVHAVRSSLPHMVAHAPVEHTWLVPHAVVHVPQCWGSLWVFVQTPLQRTPPLGHVHVPLAHVWPPVQTTPQAPQLFGSPFTLVQAPPQSSCCVGQPVALHLPARQASPAAHFMLQPPQFWKSASVSTHLPPQSVCPTGQPHFPALQTWFAAQTVPQPPQLLRSLAVSMQPPLQLTSGAVHEVRHLPALQTWLVPQAIPHPPQLAVLVARLTQALPHRSSPTSQTHCTEGASLTVTLPQISPLPQAVVQLPQ
jgi:hypothetical protein